MHLDRFLNGIIAGTILYFVCYPIFFKKKRFFKNICIAGLFIYSCVLISITMIYAPPWNWNISKSSTEFALSSINFIPFRASAEIYNNCKRIGNYSEFIRLVGGNTLLLTPLAVLVPLIDEKYRFIRITLLAMIVSFCIEALQLFSNITLGRVMRTVEIDDFIQNTLGCMVAYILFACVRLLYRKFKIRVS